MQKEEIDGINYKNTLGAVKIPTNHDLWNGGAGTREKSPKSKG